MAQPQAGKFNIAIAQMGYDLNKMCHTLNLAKNRAALLADERAFLDQFGLSAEERDAVARRDKQRLFELGGNMYFLAKLDRVPKP